MKRSLLAGLLFCLAFPTLCSARIELGMWPLFGMQRNNHVVFANDNTGRGFTGRLGWVLNSDAAAGFTLLLDLNYLSFGTERWYTQIAPRTDRFCDIYSDYRIVSLCPGVSFESRRNGVRPYFEVFGGPARFTLLNKFDNSRWDGEPLDQVDDFSRNSFVAGAGGGVKVVLWEEPTRDGKESRLKNVAVDIKAGYQHSGRNDYVVKQKLNRPDSSGPVNFSLTSSKANLLLFRFGIVMSLY